MTRDGSDSWFVRSGCRTEPAFRLICFPYAGGSAGIFHGWAKLLPPEVELVAVQLPGREGRFREPPLRSMDAAVAELLLPLESLLDVPFALFGYSLGGLMAYEATQALRERGSRMPRRLLIAASAAPHCNHARNPVFHLLPYDELIEAIRRFQGTPEAVLRNVEVMKLMTPMIRADFEILETYRAAQRPPLPIPIGVYGGTEDHEVPPDKLAEWIDYTGAGFSMQFLPGDHFFLKNSAEQLLSHLAGELKSDLAAKGK